MKRLLALLLLGAAATLFGGDEKSSNAIVKLLNSRAAGSPNAYEAAAKIVLADAEAGQVVQQFLIALVAADPDAPDVARIGEAKRRKFLAASRERIREMAEIRDNPLAWYLLSLESNDRAMLRRAAAGGNVQALNAHGTIILTDALQNALITSNELARAESEAYKSFKWASDQGDANGLYNLGMCLMSGYGCRKDEQKAFECFRTAAEAGHPEAINNLGGFFRDGIVVRPNQQVAVVWFKKSAELGNTFGTLNYALALLAGDGVAKNEKGAVKLLRFLSEKRKNAEAMNVYGMCFRNGIGVEADDREAFKWFEKSAAGGFAMAMDNLAACYERGMGVEEDIRKSMWWKMKARAAMGDRNAAEWLEKEKK